MGFLVASEHIMSYAASMAKRFKAKPFSSMPLTQPMACQVFYLPHISAEKLKHETKDSAEGMLKKTIK
ncbi:MAG: hypothetical protein HY026_04305 [Deltaproteobacteria bacterium]|nr:hypothetical protein [Deltaproteobacteria bacterium]